MAFQKTMIVLEDGRRYGDVIEPWQEADHAALDSGQYRHGYFERSRGLAKTDGVGTEATTELILGPAGQRLYCAAADEDQARLLFDDVAGKFQRNPVLAPLVRVTQREIIVKATSSRLRVLASDAPSAYGLRPDWIAVDELAEWKRRDLWDSLWTATGKRPRCRVLVMSTAGWDKTSIAWEVREVARQEPDWYFSSRSQCASWLSPAWLAQQRRTLPPHVFARLHECRWVDGGGAWLSSEQVEAIFRAVPDGEGPRCLGLDIGISRDRTALAVVKRVGSFLAVEHLRLFVPTRTSRVDLTEVEEEVAALSQRYHCPVWLDPFQGVIRGDGRGDVGSKTP
jgi:Terminase large subunit, ATPase domain